MRKAVVLIILLVLSGCAGMYDGTGHGGGERGSGGHSHQHLGGGTTQSACQSDCVRLDKNYWQLSLTKF